MVCPVRLQSQRGALLNHSALTAHVMTPMRLQSAQGAAPEAPTEREFALPDKSVLICSLWFVRYPFKLALRRGQRLQARCLQHEVKYLA